MRAALLAAAFVLAGATDWGLLSPGICAIDRPSCEAAIAAHRDLWTDVPLACLPMPGCRDAREDCIAHFNCPEAER